MAKFCKCNTAVPNFDGTCKTCNRVLTWEQSQNFKISNSEGDFGEAVRNASTAMAYADEIGSYTPASKPLVPKALTLNDYEKRGTEAANRTLKFASLFESIGKMLQVLNLVALIILFLVGFFIAEPGWLKFAFWGILIVAWAISYVQTSFIRGLSSYFQMKANDYIITHWKK